MSGPAPATKSVSPAQVNAMMSELRRQRDSAMDALVTEAAKRAELSEVLIAADAEIKELRARFEAHVPATPSGTIDH